MYLYFFQFGDIVAALARDNSIIVVDSSSASGQASRRLIMAVARR